MWILSLIAAFFLKLEVPTFANPQVTNRNSNAHRLEVQDIIPPDYDGLRTPRVKGPAKVGLTIVIMNVRNVDVSEMSIRFDLMLTKRWTDERLIFPPFADEEKVVLDLEWRKQIWMPDVFFENSIEGHVQDTIIPNMFIWLFRNKTIQFTARISIEFSCHMDLRLFPHDTQECDMIIMSLAHTEDEMQLVWHEKENITQGDNIVLPQFEIIQVASADCKKGELFPREVARRLSSDTEHPTSSISLLMACHLSEGTYARFSCLKGSVSMSRRSGYYITNVYVPTTLIVFMSMLSFWIPAEAVPARVTLGVTSLLTIVTKQYQASLPNVSYIVALNIWLSACIGFVFVSLLEYAAVIALHTKQKKAKISVSAIRDHVAAVHKIYPRDTRSVRNVWIKKRQKRESFWTRHSEKITPDNIDYVSRILFPCVFISQCSIYWALYYR
ncbi:glycine receptor subunit alphaZ1-like [Uloborus diversus]|uniref:glycine receptor subunit alphaZ1-like n=1 Tax=Uloborus diversus TaxID=327109 RepID=UPI00240A005F|nr:glycine receptor subunit alphaZ1-like [Uloborus diversus]